MIGARGVPSWACGGVVRTRSDASRRNSWCADEGAAQPRLRVSHHRASESSNIVSRHCANRAVHGALFNQAFVARTTIHLTTAHAYAWLHSIDPCIIFSILANRAWILAIYLWLITFSSNRILFGCNFNTCSWIFHFRNVNNCTVWKPEVGNLERFPGCIIKLDQHAS